MKKFLKSSLHIVRGLLCTQFDFNFCLSIDVNIHIKVDGTTKVIPKVRPGMLISELLQQNQINTASRSDIYCTDMITVEDTEHITPEQNPYLQPPSSAQPLYPFTNDEDFTFKHNSLWTMYAPPNTPKQSPFTYYTQYYYQKYDNYINHILQGYITYGEISDFPRISHLVVGKPTKVRKVMKSTQNAVQSKSLALEVTKYQVIIKVHVNMTFLQKIAQLEYQIKQLENEKRYGTRDMDSIEDDISTLRREINSIRRNEINMFYYF